MPGSCFNSGRPNRCAILAAGSAGHTPCIGVEQMPESHPEPFLHRIGLPADARVLVINVTRIGDTLLAIPLLRALRAACPQGRLDCVAHPGRAPVLESFPWIDQLFRFTKTSAWWRGRFGHRWDYAFVLGQDRALIQYALRTSRHVIAFRQNSEKLNNRLFAHVQPASTAMHAARERLLLLDPVGIDTEDLSLEYHLRAAEIDAARKWIEAHVPSDAAPLIGLQVASFPTKAYRDWPLTHFIELAKRVRHTWPKAHMVLLGGHDVLDRGKAFAAEFPDCSSIACGQFPLRGSVALMSQLDAYVGVDTGPTHLAGAIGLPMVGLYHCYHPGRYLAPQQHPGPLVVIEHPRTEGGCEPSTSMTEISVEQVWEGLQYVLRFSSSATNSQQS